MKLFKVDLNLLKEFPRISELITKNENSFLTINNSGDVLKQLPFQEHLSKLKMSGKSNKKVTTMFVELFDNLKMKSDYGCLTDSMQIHAMFSAEKKSDSQLPHTDYQYKFPKAKDNFLAWTAVIPVTKAGSWPHLWYICNFYCSCIVLKNCTMYLWFIC